MIDNKTPRLELPLPHVDNYLEDDVARLADALSILDSAATVGADGKIPVEQLPAVAITDTFPVSSQEAMLSLNVQPGDVAIRSDVSKSFILMTTPATVLGNWKELLNNGYIQAKNAISSFDGSLTVGPSWAEIPSHSDIDLGVPLNAQAEALDARSQLLRLSVTFRSVAEFGVLSTNTPAANTAAWDIAKASGVKSFIFDRSTYQFSRFTVPDEFSIWVRKGGKIQTTGGVAPQVDIGSNVEMWNPWFESLDADRQWNRVALDDSTDVVMHSPVFKGFRHNVALPNAWGCLVQNCKRITMYNPKFEDNSQADIAFTDNNEDIEIYNINSLNGVDGALVNFEPNGNTTNRRSRFIGGVMKSMYLLTNTRTADVNEFLKVSEVWIKRLRWDGADAIFENCTVDAYENYRTTEVYGGTVSAKNTKGMGLSATLLPDPYMTSLSTAADTRWTVEYSTLPPTQRYALATNPRLVDINPSSQNASVQLKSTDVITVTPGEVLLLAITGQVISDASSSMASHVKMAFLNGATPVRDITVRTFMQAAGANEGMRTQVAFVVVPSGATSLQVSVFNSSVSSTTKLRLKAVSLHRVTQYNEFDSVLSQIHATQQLLPNIIKPVNLYAYHLSMVTGQDVVVGTEKCVVSNGTYLNPTSSQIVPQISKYNVTLL